jgi:hypothetical protein
MRPGWTVVVPALALAAFLAGAAPARATVGGPTLADVLGWSPAEQRVYVHMMPISGGDDFGEVLYFALDSDLPERPNLVAWSRGGEGTVDDPVLQDSLAALRGRLVPLAPEPAVALPQRITVETADTLRDCFDAPRFRVRVQWQDQEFVVTCFFRSDVVVKDAFRVPGRHERLLLISFIGDCSEGGYETQEPVMLADLKVRARQVPWQGGD